MKITIFGNPGTGKSTVGKLLASKLGFEFKSSGNMFRAMAEEKGVSIYQFDSLSQTDPQYDIALDKMVEAYGKGNDNFVFESRLAWHFIPDSIKISLICEEGEAARRTAQRDNISLEEARENNNSRMATYLVRYPKCYPGLVYPPSDDTFDLIVDATSILPDEIVEKILAFIHQLDAKGK